MTALDSENRLSLGQVKVDEKSNEITAIPRLLRLIDIQKSIVTMDAMGTQTEIVQTQLVKKLEGRLRHENTVFQAMLLGSVRIIPIGRNLRGLG